MFSSLYIFHRANKNREFSLKQFPSSFFDKNGVKVRRHLNKLEASITWNGLENDVRTCCIWV